MGQRGKARQEQKPFWWGPMNQSPRIEKRNTSYKQKKHEAQSTKHKVQLKVHCQKRRAQLTQQAKYRNVDQPTAAATQP